MNIDTILCDRDGTLIVDKHYLSNPQGVELLPTVFEGISLLKKRGCFVGIVTNQSGIGRGYFTEHDAILCNNATIDLLQTPYGSVDIVELCPHTPEESCMCRKPSTAMWGTIKKQYGRMAEKTVMIGDKKEDIFFASNAGFPYAFLVYTGNGEVLFHQLEIPEKAPMEITIYFKRAYPNVLNASIQLYGVPSFIDAVNIMEQL